MLLWTLALAGPRLPQRQKLPCRYAWLQSNYCTELSLSGLPSVACLADGCIETLEAILHTVLGYVWLLSLNSCGCLQKRTAQDGNDPLAWEMLGYLHTLRGNDAAATEALGKCVVSSR